MGKKKALVFDSKMYFGRFLKYEFADSFVFNVYKDFRNFDDRIDGYDLIVFMIYSDNELLDMMRLYKRNVPLMVSSLNKEMKKKLEKIKDIILFDCDKVKAEMKLELAFCINTIC